MLLLWLEEYILIGWGLSCKQWRHSGLVIKMPSYLPWQIISRRGSGKLSKGKKKGFYTSEPDFRRAMPGTAKTPATPPTDMYLTRSRSGSRSSRGQNVSMIYDEDFDPDPGRTSTPTHKRPVSGISLSALEATPDKHGLSRPFSYPGPRGAYFPGQQPPEPPVTESQQEYWDRHGTLHRQISSTHHWRIFPHYTGITCRRTASISTENLHEYDCLCWCFILFIYCS